MSSFDLKKTFRKSYTENYPIVLSSLYKKVGNREDAEDICHEVFIKFLNNLETIENHRNWLFKASQFEITNYYRRKATLKREESDIDDVLDNPHLKYENGFRDTRILIQDAIENEENYTDERERILFDLIAIYDFSYKEAGKYLNITKWQAEYIYKKIETRILLYLKQKGIKELEDIL